MLTDKFFSQQIDNLFKKMLQTPESNWKLELCQSVRKMRRPREVVFLLALFLLLGTLHGTRGQYDDYDNYNLTGDLESIYQNMSLL